MKTLLMLCGLHKTGSTTVQRALAMNQGILAKYSIDYPIIKLVSGTGRIYRDANHSGLIKNNFSGLVTIEDRWKNKRKLAAYLQSSKCDTLIISSEEISRLQVNEINDCKFFFVEQGYEIRTALFIRKIRAWVDSIVSQRIAGYRGPKWTMDQVFADFVRQRGFVKPLVQNVTSVFPDIDLFSFDSLLEHPGGLLAAVVNWAQLRELNLKLDAESTNERVADAVVRFADFVHRETLVNGAAIKNQFWMEHDIFAKFKGRKFHLRQSELEKYLPILRAENNWLEETYGDEFFDSQINFFYEELGRTEFQNFTDAVVSELSLSTQKLLAQYFKSAA